MTVLVTGCEVVLDALCRWYLTGDVVMTRGRNRGRRLVARQLSAARS